MMNDPHELEQLSAFLDGELDEPARARVEAHVSACGSCRQVLDALRTTAADLRALPEPAPSEQDSWALRAAIARARKPVSRWQRWATGTSAAAATLVLIVAAVVLRNGGDEPATTAMDAFGERAITSAALPVEVWGTSFDQDTARALMPGSVLGAPADAPAEELPEERRLDEADGHGEAIAACETTLFAAEGFERIPLRYLAAPYGSVNAYLMLYDLPSQERYELWVVAQAECSNVLLFEQRAYGD